MLLKGQIPRPNLKTVDDYKRYSALIKTLPKDEQTLIFRDMLRHDLFFLMVVGLSRYDLMHPWLLARCKEVETKPNGYIDLWARAHGKSSIITLGMTIQDILSSHGDDPDRHKWYGREVTAGIFSATRPLAKQFLGQIKREFEVNDVLRAYFPDILWENPHKDSPMWSLDAGIIVKRKSNPKEATVEAWGVVDGQPTSKHFSLLVYDDVVTIENVRSPEMISKTTQAWELSLNLSMPGGNIRYVGTRYHFNDTYKTIIERNAATPRIHPATLNGTMESDPVLLSKEDLEEKRRFMGPYTFNSQMLLNPVADQNQGFRRDWLLYHEVSDFTNMNRYVLVDPANEKKKSNDYTAMVVVGLGQDSNYYILDWVRDRLSLTERADVLFRLHRKYKPKDVGYERYGMQADISHIKDMMRRVNYNFKIIELGGSLSKNDRIRKLIPVFEQGRMYLPQTCYRTNYENKTEDLVEVFVNQEYLNFPVSLHDDMLDVLARIVDENFKVSWPRQEEGYFDELYTPRGSAWSV